MCWLPAASSSPARFVSSASLPLVHRLQLQQHSAAAAIEGIRHCACRSESKSNACIQNGELTGLGINM